MSPRKHQRFGLIPQLLSAQHDLLDKRLAGCFLAGEDPEVFAVGGADEGGAIVWFEVEDPVIAGREGHPFWREFHLQS